MNSLLRRWSLSWLALPAALALLGACEGDGPGPAQPRAYDGGRQLTWYGDIAPIAYHNCAMCHREGGIAPFSMIDDPALIRANAVLMKQKTAAREMPPMPVDNSGDCNTYANARWLDQAEIDLIGQWVDQGAQLGDPMLAPSIPPLPRGLTGATDTLVTGTDYAPHAQTDGQKDDYHCFIARPGNTADEYLTGYEVIPGDGRVVHHVIVYSVPNDAAEAQAMTNDNNDASAGYTCFGGPGVGGSAPLALWAPGVGPTTYPMGTGLLVDGNRPVIVQVHYNLASTDPPYNGATTVRLRRAPMGGAIQRAILAPVLWHGLDVPPGQELATDGTDLSLDFGGILPTVRVWGAIPHMHTLGRTLHVTATDPRSNTQCLVDVDRWNFHWQNLWWYERPLRVDLASTFRIDCGYDTRTRMSNVTWGEGTSDEMCLAYFYVSL